MTEPDDRHNRRAPRLNQSQTSIPLEYAQESDVVASTRAGLLFGRRGYLCALALDGDSAAELLLSVDRGGAR